MAAAEADITETSTVQTAFVQHRRQAAKRAFTLAASIVWAIEESYLQKILEVAARQNDVEAFASQYEALAARRDSYLENTSGVQIRDSVAIINIEGPIFRYANLFCYFSGGTSTEMLARDFNTALNDPAVNSILLNIDSPGGEANGINELAQMVYAARGKKEIVAYIGGYGCSGAYWIASAADRIVCDATAILGSIGVRCAFMDDKEALKMEGLREIIFVASQSPNKAPNPATPKGAAQVQATVDGIAEVFIAAVARNRGITPEQVVEQYGAGATMVGQGALDAGLSDSLGSFEQTLAELSGTTTTPGNNNSTARASLPASSIPTRGATVMANADEDAKGATKENDEEDEEDMKDEKKDKKEASAPPANPSASATATPPASGEPSAELKAAQAAQARTAAELKEANERISALELKDRTARFTAIAKDFVGGADAHLPMMEHLASSVGEDSPLFTGYIETQRATAAQLEESALFAEKGKTSVEAATGSAEAQLEAKAAALMAADAKLTKAQAMSQAMEANPELYRQHVAEQQGR